MKKFERLSKVLDDESGALTGAFMEVAEMLDELFKALEEANAKITDLEKEEANNNAEFYKRLEKLEKCLDNHQAINLAHEKDLYIIKSDQSTTKIFRASNCCGGGHQTIAGALLNSKEWEVWSNHAREEMLFEVDETAVLDRMSEKHFREFIEFIKE